MPLITTLPATLGRRVRGLTMLLLTLAMASPAAAQTPVSPPASQKPASTPVTPRPDYVIGASDVLFVQTFEQPTFTGKFVVQADGTFEFPQLGRVTAGGLTVPAVEKDIRDRLAKQYLKNPQVAISVEQARSQQVIVLGEVRNPQALPFTGSMTVMEALAKVGSWTERAGPEALILHENDPKPTKVNLEQLLTGVGNVSLRSGDTISVPPSEKIMVRGQVVKPGVIDFRPGMTVVQAITLAGGPTAMGSERRVQITRKVNGKDTTFDAKMSDPVLAGDSINVRQGLL